MACRLAKKPLSNIRATRVLSREETERIKDVLEGEESDEEPDEKEPDDKPKRSPSSPVTRVQYPVYSGSIPPSPAVVFRRVTGASPLASLVSTVPASPMVATRGILPTPRTVGPLVPFAYPANARSYSTLRTTPATARSYSTLRRITNVR